MAELIRNIQQLESLPEELHWFCPRQSAADDAHFYAEDIQSGTSDEDDAVREHRARQVDEAKHRKELVFNAIQILAYNGKDAEPYQKWLKDRLNAQLAKCDICIREYYRGRKALRDKLQESYEEEEVTKFLDIFDKMNIERIKKGLNHATHSLQAVPFERRGISALDGIGLYAIFETLSCDAFLKNDDLLSEYFDEPFELVQTKKRLKLNNVVPAMTAFLFGSALRSRRSLWATHAWVQFRRNITATEFKWSVEEYLLHAIRRVYPITTEAVALVPVFWSGVKLIVDRLDHDLITHSLRGMEVDLHKVALDHLAVDSNGFLGLMATIRILLEKSPTDFWDAMGAISPANLVEVIFQNRYLQRTITDASEEDGNRKLEEVFSWVNPFLTSIKVANQGPACRSLANQLIGTVQENAKYPRVTKEYCMVKGFEVLVQALTSLNTTQALTVGRAIVSDALDVVSQLIERIMGSISTPPNGQQSKQAVLSGKVIRLALALDCRSLHADMESIMHGKAVQHAAPTDNTKTWRSVVLHLRSNNTSLASNALIGVRELIGMEKFVHKSPFMPKIELDFNSAFDNILRHVAEILERLNDFEITALQSIFESPESNNAMMATLFFDHAETHQAAVDLLKTISSQTGRREAIGHILNTWFSNTVNSLSSSIRRIAHRRIFAPAPGMLKLTADILDNLCNTADGILRSRPLSTQTEWKAVENLWQALWQALTVIFEMTETWSNMGHDKGKLMEFCRDAMQLADDLFGQYSVFASALSEAPRTDNESVLDVRKGLLEQPKLTMNGMVRWLRLRDDFLVTTSFSLIRNILVRLHEFDIQVAQDPLHYIEDVVTSKTKTMLKPQQKAELHRALEIHAGVTVNEDAPSKFKKQGSISSWVKSGVEGKEVIDVDNFKAKSESGKEEELDLKKIISQSSRSVELYKAQQALRQGHRQLPGAVSRKFAQDVAQRTVIDPTVSEFRRKREEEREAKKKRDALAIAQAKKNLPQHVEGGSGLHGLGVQGKDHSLRGSGMMVSSDEEESDEDDPLSKELFGITKAPKKPDAGMGLKVPLKELKQGPVRKQRQIRSAKDMRARLAPDLTSLHKALLGWEYLHTGEFPPGTEPDEYSAAPNTFRNPTEYQSVWRVLLMLEAWQGFVKAKEEPNSKPYETKVVNRSSVDAFVEISSSMTHAENKEIPIAEGDIVLLSKAQSPGGSPNEAHCLSRVYRVSRKKAHIEVLYRVNSTGNALLAAMVPGALVHGLKLLSITPLEREFGSLLALPYYDLCDEVIKAKPSPLLKYTDRQLESISTNYALNTAQAKAVKSAMDNDAFTLIQGPPGSGKTKTIVAIVGAMLTDTLRDNKGTAIEKPKPHANVKAPVNRAPPPKKLLVCAPSNAAVDELVMRFKEGVKITTGEHRKVSVVRIGRSDAINANILDVTLDSLVNAKLGANDKGGSAREQTQKIMKEHQAVSEKLREARTKLDEGEAKGKIDPIVKDEFDALRRRKAQLSMQIDNARDNENTESRQADLNRRKVQQSILDDAHVICATLSGSGHEMFQGLNIEFETVIIDEAAQCVELSSLIPMKYGCAKCILVGDPQQLPPTVFSNEARRFQYEKSLFVRMQQNHPDDVHLLDTQYRMHPEISAFPSKQFYDGRLLDGPGMASLRQKPWHSSSLFGPYRFFDVQGQHQSAPKGHSLINIAEINVALALVDRLITDVKDYDFRGKIGIITPYRSQLRELKEHFARKYGQAIFETIEFNTTDAFQGREAEVIIFSCVRASSAGGVGFLADIRRMNVGLTRAKSSLWVLGNSESLQRGQYWKRLIEDAQGRGLYTDGDLLGMLRKPMKASAVGSLAETVSNGHTEAKHYVKDGQSTKVKVLHKTSATNGSTQSVVKQESVSHLASAPMHSKGTRDVQVKLQSMPERHQYATSKPNIKREPGPKRERSDSDVEMKDVVLDYGSSESVSRARPLENAKSNQSVNGTFSEAKEPAVTIGGNANSSIKQDVGNPAPPRPKVHLTVKKRKEVDPFIRPKPKKPRP